MAGRSTLWKQRCLFLAIAVAVYGGLLVAKDFLQGPALWDEEHFWATSLSFSTRFVPTIEQLRGYAELNTPLPFVVFGVLERLFRQGMFAGRLLNVFLSGAIVFMVGWPVKSRGWRSLRCFAGLLLCPYFLLYSGLLYTDIIACFFVLVGIVCYRQDFHWLSCVAFMLAIASRQFMLAFPAAIALYEFVISTRKPSQSSSMISLACWKNHQRWIAPAVATCSILGWIILFGGLAPKPAFTKFVMLDQYSTMLVAAVGDAVLALSVPPVQRSLWALTPGAAINFLAFVTLYIVLPEAILFVPRYPLRHIRTYLIDNRIRLATIAISLLLFVFMFPPLHSRVGILIKITNQIPDADLKFTLVYLLALISCLRFSKFDVVSLSVWANCLIMMKAYPWDKYVLPLVVVFWYWKARDRFQDEEVAPL